MNKETYKPKLIPEPRKIRIKPAKFEFTKETEMVFDKSNPGIVFSLQLLADSLKDKGIKANLSDKYRSGTINFSNKFAILIVNDNLNKKPDLSMLEFNKLIKEEGYTLNIDKDKILLVAIDTSGLFYGIQTIIQLLEEENNKLFIKCLEIEDYPELKIRGIHMNLWSQMPKVDYLKDIIKRAGHYKINTILLEYEDKFPYKKHPVIKHNLALTELEIKEIISFAGKYYIQIIPLVQSISHVSYILKHKEYALLRERKENIVHSKSPVGNDFQFCPLHPGSLEQFKDMAGEVIELHPYKYFHIGADEAYFLGECEQCKEFVKKEGKSKLYIDYINKVSKFIKSKGKIPVMWHDMLRDFPEAIDSLDKDICIVYWNYGTMSDKIPFVSWGGRALFGEEIVDWVPKEILSLYKKYWDGGNFPEVNNGYPYIKFFQDKGFRVFGSPCCHFEPKRSVRNTITFCKEIAKTNGLGILNTHWPSGSGIGNFDVFELHWINMLCSAEYSWSPDKNTKKEYDRKYIYQFYGSTKYFLVDYIYDLWTKITSKNASEIKEKCQKLSDILKKEKFTKNKLNIEYFIMAADFKIFLTEATVILNKIETQIIRYINTDRAYFANVGLWRGFTVSDKKIKEDVLKKAISELRILKQKTEKIKQKVRESLNKTIKSADVEKMLGELSVEKKINQYLGQIQLHRASKESDRYRDSIYSQK
ncbi:MAG: beta-N-acetylhexosaminidase [Elusimicrobia bacterium]|nr:beta-N-acetylhexosaminidase [Elusimicrobiota bacterium]